MLCDTLNRSGDNDAVCGPSQVSRYSILPRYRKCATQSQCFQTSPVSWFRIVITEMCVSSSLSTQLSVSWQGHYLLCILHEVLACALVNTRSQAVARIADRTSSQHFCCHVTSSVTKPFDTPYAISYWWSFWLTKPLPLTISEIFDVECDAMVDMTLIRPLNKGWGEVIHFSTNWIFIRLTSDFL